VNNFAYYLMGLLSDGTIFPVAVSNDQRFYASPVGKAGAASPQKPCWKAGLDNYQRQLCI
jgi:hypothetical protein